MKILDPRARHGGAHLLAPAFGKQRWVDLREFKVSLVHLVETPVSKK